MTQGEELKRIIRNCYKDKIENYFSDIIFHTADNAVQSRFIYRLFYPSFNLTGYFNEIKKYNYMVIKYETENMTKDFPKTAPFSKDIDIICSKDDYEKTAEYTENYLKQFNDYELRIINSGVKGKKFRLELNGFLIFQIDLRTEAEGIKNSFIEACLASKIEKGAVFIPDIKHELCFRAAEAAIYPDKKHHLKYIAGHSEFLDFELLKSSSDINTEAVIKEYIQLNNLQEKKLNV